VNQKGQILDKIILGFVFIIVYLVMLVAVPPIVNELAAESLNNAELVQFGATILLLIQVIYLIIGIMVLVFIISPRAEPPPGYGQSGFY